MSLSMMIYLASVCGQLNSTVSALSVAVGVVGGLILGFTGAFQAIELGGLSKIWWRLLTAYVIIVSSSILLGVFVPSRDTVMQIATIEVGTQLLQSKDGQEISGQAIGITKDGLKLIQQYITDQLKDTNPR